MQWGTGSIVLIFLLAVGGFLAYHSLMWLWICLVTLILLELLSFFVVRHYRKNFQWLITPLDERPNLDKEGLRKFIEHGYDPELGWIRKPHTSKQETGKEGTTTYNIDASGSRSNPGHEKLPKKISFYGDSFLFGRQVNDNETCQWHLSELTQSNVLNFSVGNYGLDQAYLRLQREFPQNKTSIVVMGVVPSTIVRILTVWKHYNEFGNTFGFKPRYVLDDGKLKLISNFIDSEDKFEKYEDYLEAIQKYDYFYKTKFRKEMIQFPYFVSLLSNPSRNLALLYHLIRGDGKVTEGGYPLPMSVIMNINLQLRVELFEKNKEATMLLTKIVEDFSQYAKKHSITPVFLLMPQKDDLIFIKKHHPYYQSLLDHISKKIITIDLTEDLLKRESLDAIYSDDNVYGGHYSDGGNKLVAEIIHSRLQKQKLL